MTRLDGLGDWVTLRAATRLRGGTYWQVRYLMRRHHLPRRMIGNTVLVRLTDLAAAAGTR